MKDAGKHQRHLSGRQSHKTLHYDLGGRMDEGEVLKQNRIQRIVFTIPQ